MFWNLFPQTENICHSHIRLDLQASRRSMNRSVAHVPLIFSSFFTWPITSVQELQYVNDKYDIVVLCIVLIVQCFQLCFLIPILIITTITLDIWISIFSRYVNTQEAHKIAEVEGGTDEAKKSINWKKYNTMPFSIRKVYEKWYTDVGHWACGRIMLPARSVYPVNLPTGYTVWFAKGKCTVPEYCSYCH